MRVIINDISIYGYHGVLPSEQKLGQEFLVSLLLEFELPDSGSDSLEEVLDYRLAIEAVREIIGGRPCKLLETLARRIAEKLLSLPGAREVTVKIGKPHPPIPGVKGGVFVEITRRQETP